MPDLSPDLDQHVQGLVEGMPPTLLWTLLIYWQPIILASGVPTAAPRLMAYGLIGLGLWLGLESTDLTSDQRRRRRSSRSSQISYRRILPCWARCFTWHLNGFPSRTLLPT